MNIGKRQVQLSVLRLTPLAVLFHSTFACYLVGLSGKITPRWREKPAQQMGCFGELFCSRNSLWARPESLGCYVFVVFSL